MHVEVLLKIRYLLSVILLTVISACATPPSGSHPLPTVAVLPTQTPANYTLEAG